MAFATIDDVEARRGMPLGESEKGTVQFLLEAAQGVLEEIVDRDESEIIALKGVIPPVLRFLVVEQVLKALVNPDGLASQSEALGAYSHTERYAVPEPSLMGFSPIEERLARKAVYGRLSGAGEMASLVSDERVVGS